MAKTVLFENEFVVLWYHSRTGIIHHKVKQPVMGDGLRTVLDLGYTQLGRNRACKWLSDDRLLGAFSREDQEWCERIWFPKTRAAGWKYWAIVLPESVLGKMSLNYFENRYSEQGITTKFFDIDDLAYAWLIQQPNDPAVHLDDRPSKFSPVASVF